MMDLAEFTHIQTQAFEAAHPKSHALSLQSSAWLGSVPMHWMGDWASPFAPYIDRAKDATIWDVDGVEYDDFCLGDTPSMFGHARDEIANAIAKQAGLGMGYMLPNLDSQEVGGYLAQRFCLPKWQVTTTASDANRCAINWARAITKRDKILVFDGCYHGMVDECMVSLYDGVAHNKLGLIGKIVDQTKTTKTIGFNDIVALEAALKDQDMACVLAEPVMTNCGMIAPNEGFHQALREMCTRFGSLLILDETHTISSSPNGYCGQHGLKPDIMTLGKAIAGGVPAAVFGVTQDVSERMGQVQAEICEANNGHTLTTSHTLSTGMGTTLSGNALAMAAIKAMVCEVMTPLAYEHMLRGAQRLRNGLEAVIKKHDLPWCVVHVGARLELVFAHQPPQNAHTMRAAQNPQLLHSFHLYLMNQAILIAPFHNMMLLSPKTSDMAIDRLIKAIDGFAHIYKDLK